MLRGETASVAAIWWCRQWKLLSRMFLNDLLWPCDIKEFSKQANTLQPFWACCCYCCCCVGVPHQEQRSFFFFLFKIFGQHDKNQECTWLWMETTGSVYLCCSRLVTAGHYLQQIPFKGNTWKQGWAGDNGGKRWKPGTESTTHTQMKRHRCKGVDRLEQKRTHLIGMHKCVFRLNSGQDAFAFSSAQMNPMGSKGSSILLSEEK